MDVHQPIRGERAGGGEHRKGAERRTNGNHSWLVQFVQPAPQAEDTRITQQLQQRDDGVHWIAHPCGERDVPAIGSFSQDLDQVALFAELVGKLHDIRFPTSLRCTSQSKPSAIRSMRSDVGPLTAMASFASGWSCAFR
jgi:hypothetical protein